LHHDRNQALEFTTIPKEPFPLPHYTRICDLPSVALEVQTALQVSLFEQWQNVHASSPVNSLFPSYRIFKLVTRWGECVNVDGEYDEKNYTLVE